MTLPPGALDGTKVIDWTIWQFGPVAATMMGDLGADVVKVESLDGDHARQFPPRLYPGPPCHGI